MTDDDKAKFEVMLSGLISGRWHAGVNGVSLFRCRRLEVGSPTAVANLELRWASGCLVGLVIGGPGGRGRSALTHLQRQLCTGMSVTCHGPSGASVWAAESWSMLEG